MFAMTNQMAAAVALAALFSSAIAGVISAEQLSDEVVSIQSRKVVFGGSMQSDTALKSLVARGNADVVPTLVSALRYRPDDTGILEAVAKLTGEAVSGWKEAMLWQEAHPEVVPHVSYREIKLEILRQIDPQFLRFLGGDLAKPENLKIRLEEITWGGVPVDGIPSLDDPESPLQARVICSTTIWCSASRSTVMSVPIRCALWVGTKCSTTLLVACQ